MKTEQVFVLEVDGRPTLAFEAPDADVADELCDDDLLRTDLISVTANGRPVCSTHSRLTTRFASPSEIAVFENAFRRSPASDAPLIVFLIKIDGIVMMSLDPG